MGDHHFMDGLQWKIQMICYHKYRVPILWMVYNGFVSIQMDDLGVALF